MFIDPVTAATGFLSPALSPPGTEEFEVAVHFSGYRAETDSG